MAVDRLGRPLRDDPFRGNARVVATSNITLSGLQTIDGVTLESGDRVLAIGQTTASQNGIYVASNGVWSRSRDLSTSDDFNGPIYVAVEEGTVGRNKTYSFLPSAAVTVDSTSISFTENTLFQLVDGDKGDITVSSNGTVWEIDAGAVGTSELAADAVTTPKIADANVTLAKMADIAQARIIGRASGAGTGVPTALTGAQVNAIVQPGTVTPQQYGAAGDGVTDDTAAIEAAATANGGYVTGVPGSTYRMSLGTTSWTPPANFVFDLNGATLLPVYTGTSYAIENSISTTSYTVNTQNEGATDVVLSADPSATLSAGDDVYFTTTNLGGNFPPSFRNVTSISTTTVGLDRIIPFAYGATISMFRIALGTNFVIKNGTINATSLGSSCLGIARVSGYRYMELSNVRTINASLNTSTSDNLYQFGYSPSVVMRDNRIDRAVNKGAWLNARYSGYADISNNRCTGTAFGIVATHVDYAVVTDNQIHGRFQEGGGLSVRGIKVTANKECFVSGNKVVNFDSGVKVENTAGAVIIENDFDWCGISINVSALSPTDTAWERHIIADNNININTNTSGAIVVAAASGSETVISRNLINRAYGHGINASDTEAVITENTIQNWGRSTAASSAIVAASTATGLISDNRMKSDSTTQTALNVDTSATTLRIGDNYTEGCTDWHASNRGGIHEKATVDVASATTTDIGAAASIDVRITGTTAITGLGTVPSGIYRRVRFAGALTLTHNASSLILPGGANITTAAGDTMLAVSEGSGNWRVHSYVPAGALPINRGGTGATTAAAARTNLSVREQLTASRTYYVRADGSDSNTGLADSSGGAFLTIQKAIDTTAALDLGTYSVTVNVGAGTYANFTLKDPVTGGGTCQLTGDTTTPTNVVINGTSGDLIASTGSRLWSVRGFHVTPTTGQCVGARNGGVITLNGNMHYGATTGYHIYAAGNSRIAVSSGYTISGNASRHISCENASSVVYSSGLTITLTGTPAFSSAFALVNRLSLIVIFGETFSGSGTGTRYSATGNGVIETNGGGATYLPGDAAGSAASGGQYI